MLESLTGRGGGFCTLPCATEKHGGARGPADWQGRGEVCPQGHLLKLKKERQGRGKA